MTQPTNENPNVGRYVLESIRDELRAFLLLLRRQWVVALLLLAVLAVVLVMLKPLPPTEIRIAKGQPNSGLEVMANRMRDHLAPQGITLKYVESSGALDSMRLVSEGKADVAFSQSGLPPARGVHYLGSVAYQPMWLFFRGARQKDTDLATFLVGKRISIGVEGSSSRFMADLLLNQLGEDVRSRIHTLGLSNAKTLEGLKDGSLDGAILVASYDSRNIQTLLADPAMDLFSFPMTAGLARQIRYLEPVVLHAGSVQLFPPVPSRDIHMVAPTMTMVVRDDLHRATQTLLLSTAQALYGQDPDVFIRNQGFPAFVDRNLPRSKTAVRFYERGGPVRYGNAPYWIAELIDSVWVGALTLLAIVYPLMRIMPSYRRLIFDAFVTRRYDMLRRIEWRVVPGASTETLTECHRGLLDLRERVRTLWVPRGCDSAQQALLKTVNELEAKVRERLRS